MSVSCFHCLESVPNGFRATVTIDNTPQPMCCIGCQAVAQNIVDQGMTDYYKYRTVRAGKVEQLVPEQLAFIKSYDNEDIQDEFIATTDNLSQVLLSVEGITCAACAWLAPRPNHRHAAIAQAVWHWPRVSSATKTAQGLPAPIRAIPRRDVLDVTGKAPVFCREIMSLN